MKDTDQIHTKDTEEQGITLPYLKSSYFFYYIWFLRSKHGICTSISNDGKNISNASADPNNLGWFLFCRH